VENRVSGDRADDDAVAWNYSDGSQESCRQPAGLFGSGESRATAQAAPPTRFTHFARHAANRSPSHRLPGEPRPHLHSEGGVAAAEATVRAAIGDRGKNGSGALPTAAAVIRHRRTSQLVIEPIVHDCSEHCGRRRLRQHVRGRVVFRGVEPERRPSHAAIATQWDRVSAPAQIVFGVWQVAIALAGDLEDRVADG
jgi:hypothetical protein